jgi:hypothetical protein
VLDVSALPGAELVEEGLRDLARGVHSASALLVLIGAPRLRGLGIDVPSTGVSNPEHALYDLLAREDPDSAHSRYNALIRRLVSFERAADLVAR